MNFKNLFLALCATAFIGTFSSCDKDDDINPSANYVEALTAKYPNATAATWEKKHGYVVADCFVDYIESEVWFDGSCNWVMTEFDISYSKLPDAVRESFITHLNSTWAGYELEDVDMFVRPSRADEYVIEIEKNDNEVDLYFNVEGELLKSLVNNKTDERP